MSEQKATGGRLEALLQEGHDNLGALELALGGAVLLGYLFWALLPHLTWLDLTAFALLMLGALWAGHQLEGRQLHALGRRRFRGTLLLHITWIVACWAMTLAGLLTLLAHARTWTWQKGWSDGPILLTLFLGLYHLAQGLRLGVRRWVYLGGALCGLAVVIPGLPPLRQHLYLSTAFLVGGALLVSGYLGRQDYLRQA